MKEIIEIALNDLNGYLKDSNWFGRENEVVNLFAHAFLLKHIGKGKFTSPAQVGIEVAVKQLPSSNGKKLVRKDLVIWGRENQTVWNEDMQAVNDPIAILEWKVNSESECEMDIKWLMEFTRTYPNVVGYSVCAFIKDKRGVSYKKIENGKIS